MIPRLRFDTFRQAAHFAVLRGRMIPYKQVRDETEWDAIVAQVAPGADVPPLARYPSSLKDAYLILVASGTITSPEKWAAHVHPPSSRNQL